MGGSRGWDPGCGGSSGMGEGGDIPKGVECPPCHGPVLTPCGVPLESKPAPSSPGPTANNLTRKSGLPKNTQAATGHERAHRFLPHQALLCHPTPDPPRQERQAPTRTGTQDPWREAHRFPPSGKAGIRVWLSVRGQGLGSEGSHPNSKPAHERQDAPPPNQSSISRPPASLQRNEGAAAAPCLSPTSEPRQLTHGGMLQKGKTHRPLGSRADRLRSERGQAVRANHTQGPTAGRQPRRGPCGEQGLGGRPSDPRSGYGT